MGFGYWDRVVHVDLTRNLVNYEQPGESFFRKYLGGGAVGSYYVNKYVKPGTDAYAPENVIVYSTSIVTGVPVPGFTRHSVTSVSPLTGGVLDSEAGGFWAAELKSAMIDTIVVHGSSSKPVYLFAKNGRVEIRDASKLWGKFNADVLEEVEKETGEEKLKILGIGPGGENLVRYACIMCDLHDANGRGGLGAVMGAKKLKAIVVKGGTKVNIKNYNKVLEISKEFAKKFKDIPGTKGLNAMGTTGAPANNSNSGQLPTRNWSFGNFEGVDNISGVNIHNTILAKKTGCFACPVRCKRMVQAEEPYNIDPEYAGVEYESLAALGSYLEIDDLHTVCKAIELCNKYTIDTLSLGGTIAFAMDCFENGILSLNDTDGLELRFGNKEVLIPLIEKIVKKEGIGQILAEGSKKAAEILGKESEKYAVHCKGVELPAHEPRVKRSLALTYSVCPVGADHMASEHDPSIGEQAPDVVFERIAPLGINERLPWDDLSAAKVRFTYYTMMIYSLLNTLDICMFCVAPSRALNYSEIVDAVNAVTGWETSLWELIKVGEKRLNMMRVFNLRCGIDAKEDKLPDKLFKPLNKGPHEGKYVDREQLKEAQALFYRMSGWNDEGIPEDWKLKELDIDWVM